MNAMKREPVPNDAYTVPEFCRSHRISRSLYYKLRRQGIAPLELRFDNKVLITKEAAARWRQQRTAATKQAG